MASIVNGTDIDTIANVQDGGGGGGENYSLESGATLVVEVEDAKITFSSDDPSAETELAQVTSVKNSQTVTLVDSSNDDGTYDVAVT